MTLPAEPAGRPGTRVVDRGDRRNAGGTDSGQHRGGHRDDHADHERHHDRSSCHHGGCLGQLQPNRAEQLQQADPEADADDETDHRRDRTHDESFQHDGPHHLTTRRTHRAQETKLARALGDEDREGVEDHERAHDDPDRGKAQQRVGEVLEDVAYGFADLLDRFRDGEDLETTTQGALEPGLHHTRGRAGIRLDVDAVEGAGRLEHFLRGLEVERGERHPEVGSITETEETHDLVVLCRAAQEHAHVIANRESVVRCGRRVHGDLTVSSRRAAHTVVDESEWSVLHPRRAERRQYPATDALAVTTDELCVPRDESLGSVHPGNGAHLIERALRDPGWVPGTEGPQPLDLEIDPRQRLSEDRVERTPHGVGEEIGGAHEAHPEKDRHRGEREA